MYKLINIYFLFIIGDIVKIVFHVSDEKKNKAEMILKGDDEISRGSIIVRSCRSLDIDEDGYFIVLDCSEHCINKAKELLKELAEIYKDEKKVLDKIEEQEDSAISGLGNILG